MIRNSNNTSIRGRNVSPEKIRKFRINVINGILFLVLAVSGFILISSHGGRHSPEATFLGADRGLWRTIHIITAFAYLPCFSQHLYFQRKWLSAQFNKFFSIVKGRVLVSRLIIAIASITLLTGYVGYFMREMGSGMAAHGFVEIHDKFGLIMIVVMLIHIRYNVLKHRRKVLAIQED